MSHEFESGLFVSEPAWHGLGVVLDSPPTLADAIRLAGLDWTVKLADLQLTADGRGVAHKATIRESDGSILGVVGPGWRPLQNAEAFAWFQPFIDAGSARIEAAGSLFEGRKIWVLARVSGGEAEVVPGDEVRQYVLLAHAHDGSLAVRIGFTTVRVVCANTLSFAIKGDEASSAQRLIKIAHTTGTKAAMNRVREVMDVTRARFLASVEDLRLLAKTDCSERELRRYVRAVFEPERIDDEKAAKTTVEAIVPLFEMGRGSELSRGTYWGALNAVSEFVTHEQGRMQDRRLDRQWFGEGRRVIERALGTALELAAA